MAAIGSGTEELELLHCVVLVLLHTLEAQPTIFCHALPRKHAALPVTAPTVASVAATAATVAVAAARRGVQQGLGLRVFSKERAEVRQVKLEV